MRVLATGAFGVVPKAPVVDGLVPISGSEFGDQPVEAALGVFEDLVEVREGIALPNGRA